MQALEQPQTLPWDTSDFKPHKVVAPDGMGYINFSVDGLTTGGEFYVYDDSVHSAMKDVARQKFSGRLDVERLLKSEPETDQFIEEMNDPKYVYDPGLGVLYRANLLNRDSGCTPLVPLLGLAANGSNHQGRADLSTLSQMSGRRIIHLDPVGTGGTSASELKPDWTFDDMVASNLRALRMLGVEKMNLLGTSWGAVAAGGLAMKAGKDVENLITVSAPGFSNGLRRLVRNMPREAIISRPLLAMSTEYATRAERASQPSEIKNQRAPLSRKIAVGRLALQIIPPTLASLPEALAPETNWSDVVGSRDALTSVSEHLEAIRRRNAIGHESYTSVHILAGEEHMWAMHTPAWALAVSSILSRLEERK